MLILLIALIFISKVSLDWTGFVPREAGVFIFQGGLHPYLNLVLTILAGMFAWFRWAHRPETRTPQTSTFKFYILSLCGFLVLITALQIFFKVNDQTSWVQGAAAFCSIYMIYLFSRVIPSQLGLDQFWNVITKLSVALVVLSFFVLLISPQSAYKGFRFIGVFKHIPHMVTCSTLACFGLLYFLYARVRTLKGKLICFSLLGISLMALVLTGTRSATMAVLMGLFISMLIFKSGSNAVRILKFSLAVTALVGVFFFGHTVADQAYQVMTGEKSLGSRVAQDGIQTRREEFERGFEAFKEKAWVGTGILSKYNPSDDFDFKAYNSFKDPHNILMSAGVVGGWGLIIFASVGMLLLLYASIKNLFSTHYARRILAVLVLTHIPILFIYHVHLSIGGFADRIYWILFGYLAVLPQALDSHHEV